MLRVAVIGKYPRLPAPEGRFSARDIARKVAANRDITAEQHDRLLTDVAAWIMEDQRAHGADIGTDGLVRWDDPWTGFTGGIRGFSRGRRVQEFGTNTLYRRPVAIAPVAWERPVTLAAYRAAASVAPKNFRVVPSLPGPVSLAAASDALASVYPSKYHFLEALTEAYVAELKALQGVSPGVFLGEPILGSCPKESSTVATALRRLGAAGVDVSNLILLTWGGPSPLAHLVDITGLGGVSIDLVACPDAWQMAEDLPPKVQLYAGVVDAASALVERPDDLALLVRKIIRRHANTVLCPNRHFSVPRSIAAAKLLVLRSVGDAL